MKCTKCMDKQGKYQYHWIGLSKHLNRKPCFFVHMLFLHEMFGCPVVFPLNQSNYNRFIITPVISNLGKIG